VKKPPLAKIRDAALALLSVSANHVQSSLIFC
jgi:hypothetical protein